MATNLVNPQLAFASNTAIIAARKELAKIKLFATNFSAEAAQKGETMKIPVFLAGAAQAFNAQTSNYETAGGSVWWVPVTFNTHLHSTWQFSDKDTLKTNIDLFRNAGIASGESIAQGAVEAIMSCITSTSVPTSGTDPNAVDENGTLLANAPQFSANNAIAFKDGLDGKRLKNQVAKLRTAAVAIGIKPRRSILALKSDIYSELLDLLDSNVYGGSEAVREGVIPGLFGWKAIMECNEFAASETNLNGVVLQEDCLAIAARQIVPGSPSCYDEVGATTDDTTGLVFTTRKHGNPRTGDTFATIEALFGYKLIQPTKVIRLVEPPAQSGGTQGS